MRDKVFQLLNDIAVERTRQEEAEGFTPEHDDARDLGELARAGAAYALQAAAGSVPSDLPILPILQRRSRLCWPFDEHWLKPHPPRRALVIACALLMAEIERIDRRDGGRSPFEETAGDRRFRRLRESLAP